MPYDLAKTFLDKLEKVMKQLTHLDHNEDLIIVNGTYGANKALEFLRYYSDYGNYNITVKIDGSPSIVAGLDDYGYFFVSTKSFFNKTPVLNYTVEDIGKNYSNQELQKILWNCLAYLPEVIKGGVFQGDLLWHDNEIDPDNNYTGCKPNTIEYRIYDDEESRKARKAQIGIAWHTSYAGNMATDTFGMSAFRELDLHTSPKVYQVNTLFADPYDVSLLSDVEAPALEEMLSSVQSKIDSIDHYIVDQIFQRDSDISKLAMMFINARVQTRSVFYNKDEILFDFLSFVEYKAYKKIEKLTQERAINRHKKQLTDLKKYILLMPNVRQTISNVFEIHNDLMEIKNWIITKLDKAERDSVLQSFIKDVNTGPEGYVVKKEATNEMVKFVNRDTFSLANFENQRNR